MPPRPALPPPAFSEEERTRPLRELLLSHVPAAEAAGLAANPAAAIADAGGVPLARVPKGNHDYIKRTLDAGAWGIVVPMVDTVEQAKTAIAAAKYPPQGNRSVGGGMHSLNFAATAAEYTGSRTTGIVTARDTYSIDIWS